MPRPALVRRGLGGRRLLRRALARSVFVLVLGLAAGPMRLAADATTSPGSTAPTSIAATPPAVTPSAATPSAATLAAFAECSAVSAEQATRLLGYDVLPPDTTARAGGDCFFVSQSISEDGSVSYSLVTAERLAKLRPYFIAMARRCAGVQPSSPRAASCALYVKLAGVADLDAYYAARTTLPDAAPVSDLGVRSSGAVSAGGTLFVRQAGVIVEAAIERDGAFDLGRSEALARLLLERLLGHAPGPSPSGV